MQDDNTFDIIEAQAGKKNPIGSPTRKHDGFSRQDVVNAFARAFTMIGGVQRLALWANENPDKFFPLYAKLLPATSINFGDNAVVQIVHAIAPTNLDQHHDGNAPTEAIEIRYPSGQVDSAGPIDGVPGDIRRGAPAADTGRLVPFPGKGDQQQSAPDQTGD